MIIKKVKIQNTAGLQVSAAGRFCDTAMEFNSRIHFKYRGENEANAKSVLSVLGAAIRNGEEIELICEGDDEEQAAKVLSSMLEGTV